MSRAALTARGNVARSLALGMSAAAVAAAAGMAAASHAEKVAVVVGAAALLGLLARVAVAERRRAAAVEPDIAPLPTARLAFLAGLLVSTQLVLRPVVGLTASDLLFLAALVAGCVALALRPGAVAGRVPPGILIGAALFLGGACVAAFGASSERAAFATPIRFLFLVVAWFWLATVVLQRVRDIRAAVACWVLSAALSGAAAIAQLLRGDVIPNTDLGWGRMTGTAQHVNDLGGSLAVALPAAAALAVMPDATRSLRRLAVSAALLVTTGLVLSGSVGSMLAAVAGLAVTALVARRKAAFAAASAGLLGVSALTSWLQEASASSGIAARVEAVTSPSGTLAARLDVFADVWRRILDDPFVGAGFGFDPGRPGSDFADLIHNAPLAVWHQGGLLALAGLCVICVVTLRTGVRAAAAARDEGERLLAASLLGSLTAYLVFGLGEPTLYARYGWIPAALVIALAALQGQRDLSREGRS